MTAPPPGRFGFYGHFDIDFRPIGGWLTGTTDTSSIVRICDGTTGPTVAAATAHWDDSVHVTLNPCADHGALVLAGKWDSRDIAGRWYESTTGGSSGTFRMSRISR